MEEHAVGYIAAQTKYATKEELLSITELEE